MLLLVTGFLVGLVVLVFGGRRLFEHDIQGHVAELLSDAEGWEEREFTPVDIDDLPAPVQQYFETVLREDQPYVQTVRLHQRGEFRLGGRDDSWKSLEATQFFSTRPPAFVWDASIQVFPFLPARVIDLYKRGEGILRARLLSSIPIASAGPSPEMNQGELVRYLAEAVWFPTALLPSNGVDWEAIDDHSARATLEHRGITASLVFQFNDRNEVECVTAERYRQEDDSFAPWTGYFRDYKTLNGLCIPTDAEVEWNLPEGDLSYWRASVVAIDHGTVDQRVP